MDSNIMTYNTFLNNICEISNMSKKLNDGWELFQWMDEINSAYLCKKYMSKNKDNGNMYIFECHITYSMSYEVPMMCFNICNIDGKRISIKEAWLLFHTYYTNENMYSVLTEMEHPVLQTLFLTLHPCQTWNILVNFMQTSRNPIVSWLSTIAPALNLQLSNAYELLTR